MIPEFEHEDAAINNFVKLLLSNPEIKNCAQLILMSGIALNNVELIKYAAQIDSMVYRQPILNHVLNVIDMIFYPFTQVKFNSKATNSSAAVSIPPTTAQTQTIGDNPQ